MAQQEIESTAARTGIFQNPARDWIAADGRVAGYG
jgi:hypothetical protein